MENTASFEELADAIRLLSDDEKEALAEILRQDLGSGHFASKEIEAAWIEESERRVDAYLRGELEAIDGDEAMARIRATLK